MSLPAPPETDTHSATTAELFRDDASLLECEARIVAVDDLGVVLDRTVFYPVGGGQAPQLVLVDSGVVVTITDTRKHPEQPGAIAHVIAPGGASGAAGEADALARARAACIPGARVVARIDPARRRAHMRFHTATHLLCALVPHAVNGCSITAGYARLDFHMNEPLDKEALTAGIARYVAGAHAVRHRWITEAELDANPGLVRSMSVQPPRTASGTGHVRVVEIEGVDLQPCGGTHVANTRDIGAVVVTKLEKKSAMTRRVVLGFAEPAAG